MQDDAQLLRRYAEEHANEAFTELVRRHVNLVYHAALRQVGGDAALAEEVAQTVFTELARRAGSLDGRPVLAGWLYTSTRFAAQKARRAESRRRRREHAAHFMAEINGEGGRGTGGDEGAAEWERVRPVIDDALHALDERDREAVLLRFFEGRPFAEVGARLTLSEDAARKRVERALEKMQAVLARRGVTSTAAALGGALSGRAAMAAPAGVAANVTHAALAGGGLALGGAGFAGFLGFMNTTKIMGVLVAVAVGLAAFHYREARRVARSAAEEQAASQMKLRGLEEQAKVATKRAETAEADNARLLAAVAAAKASGMVQVLEEAGPISAQTIADRLRRAGTLMAEGRNEEALREYIWLIDVGMVRVPEFRVGRYQSVAPMLLMLAERANFGPAREFLRQRRGELEQQLRAGREDDPDAAMQIVDFGSINRAMKEEERTLAVYDSLPANDSRRRSFGAFVADQLIDARRYGEAAEFRTYSGMLAQIERQESMTRQGAVKGFTPARDKFLGTMGRNIEVLAGTGALIDARSLADRLFAFDGSPETRAIVQGHLDRAGQPGLLAETGKPRP
ncbi:MAG: sigma-70 family RNA polymerase sigma factor [Verrucomicrobia bacterium]|nr:sigma-70 family RNA polymerase sigma factor [Verrucomicrobiota bacterium]